MTLLLGHERRKRRIKLLLCSGSLLVLITLGAAHSLLTSDREPVDLGHPRARTSRRLDTVNLTYADWEFTVDQLRSGAVGFHIFGVLYMFLALAIVCDEYFVPALDEMVERFNISPDVAGATLMAAGGSAPELFTSLIGTFSDSEVGFGTIVGSAVFNVLFVIGCCAIFSKETLELTWWPLFRDVVCYSIALMTLALFFGVVTPYVIDWWEAFILLWLYVGYCTIMKFNERIYTFVAVLTRTRRASDMEREQTSAQSAEILGSISAFLVPYKWRKGVLQTLLDPDGLSSSVAVLALCKISGDVRQTFEQIDKDGDGYIDEAELRDMLHSLGSCEVGSVAEILEAIKARILKDGTAVRTSRTSGGRSSMDHRAGKISFEEFSQWYLASEQRLEKNLSDKFDELDRDRDGVIGRQEFEILLQRLGVSASGPAIDDAIRQISRIGGEVRVMNELVGGVELGGVEITVGEEASGPRMVRNSMVAMGRGIDKKLFTEWYKDSLFYQQAKQQAEREAELAYAGVRFCPPEDSTWRGRIKWYVVLPLTTLMAVIPDVRRPRYRHLVGVTFVMSIMYIGIFSYLMVWWATTIGEVFGIPPTVMGLTFLAAGTSIPDLLTSVIVAMQGEGDMAVSSSIGSNIFDVLIGLPLPWLAYAGIRQKPFELSDQSSLFTSIIVLFLMLGGVVGTIALHKWRMTKQLGGCMFVLYIIFLTQDLLRNYGVISLPHPF